ncbi:polyphosphate kinase 1 [Moheibacter lacus]|uniref:polyphosphate kinase 1 n=1 Tax=Moheibacter lacus TaxID=2745851 RepID=UPI00293C0FE4|nr:polyphosphate kinase 1 [Moheibacter lacus]
MSKIYVNREISWLKFNARVLQEVKDSNVPLLERLRFLGIYSNNLDEFYSVRYSALLRSIQLKSRGYRNIIAEQTDEDLIEEINQSVAIQREDYDRFYDQILLELEANNIFFIDDKNVPLEHIQFVSQYFNSELSHSIAVYILDKKLTAPAIRDGAFYLAVKFIEDEVPKYALIDVPTQIFPRFVILPKINQKQYVMYLEDIIRYHLDEIFKVFQYEFIEAHSIKITRDSELDMDTDLENSLLEKVAKSLEGRRKGEPVRIVYDREIAQDTLQFLTRKLNIDDYDSINAGGKYHNKRDLMKFPNLGRNDLEYEKITPIVPYKFNCYRNNFEAISAEDHILYAPYHDYSVFLRFLREAAIDPKVTKIKITIYRVASESQVMSALINAARNGKEVTAVLELRARFDEANNVKWSKRLQDAGVHVIFGVQGLKVHSKIGYIERLPEHNMASSYAFISTGNFHAGTAKLYTDYTLLTSQPEITQEINQVFKFFNANYQTQSYKHLLVSPMQTRKKIVKFIKKEIKNHRKGLPSGINLKLNSLSDKEIIDMLYLASNEGVKVRLVVRGIHSLITGIPGISENIASVSIIDKFLEHPRVYWFKNAGSDRVFISSADMMERNLDARVEVACPIYDPQIKKLVMDTFELSFNDNVKARIHDADESLTYRVNTKPVLRSQFVTYDYLYEWNKKLEKKESEIQ